MQFRFLDKNQWDISHLKLLQALWRQRMFPLISSGSVPSPNNYCHFIKAISQPGNKVCFLCINTETQL